MAIDGFFIKNLITEIKNDTLNSRLENITLVQSDIFSFSFYLKGKRHFLNFKLNSPNASFFIGDLNLNESLNSNFLTNLKKYLISSTLINIEQHRDDRVIVFTFKKTDFLDGIVQYQLILELMGRYNNLILLKDNIIIDAFQKNVSAVNRSIVPNLEYSFFPSNKKIFTKPLEEITEPLFYSKNYLGISPLLSKYLVEKPTNISDVTINPTLNLDTNEFYWFNLFNTSNIKIFNNLSQLLVSLTSNINKPNDTYLNFVNKRLTQLEKRLFNYQRQLETNNQSLEYVNFGNSIYSSGLNLNSYLNEIIIEDETIKLDITKTLNDNAQLYFKKYKKAKSAIFHLELQIEETNQLITLFKQFEYDLNHINLNKNEIIQMLKPYGLKTKTKQQLKKVNVSPLKLTDSNNNIYYVGLSSLQNQYIINELANKDDYWFHIKDLPGSHVLLKGVLDDNSLKIGAMLALKHSKNNQTSGLINYTQIKHLKKIPKMPAHQVTLKKYQTINIDLDLNLIANKLK